MIIGTTASALTFIALIISMSSYFLYYRDNDKSLLNLARLSFYASVFFILMQSVLLMWGILNHRFDWIYVFSYSSRSLPLYYLISTFWAGQEGTFLLWLILGSVYGIVIIRNRTKDEALVMSFMILVQAFIAMILIKRNPFSYVWEVNPSGFQIGAIPADGNGLNPLLQDPWMTIHPPILFSGYSSTMILFAFAMAALVKRNFDTWIKNVFPYALFVGLALGTGIILGGYWAYTTLGWGGYWGWDPVENSSFIPWIVTLALLHGMVIQKRQGGLKKTNIFLALLAFLLVLYGSFLTRSGVLTDFSVHSFGTSELTMYLVGFVVFFMSLSSMFFLFRVNEVKSEKVQTAFLTRETFMLYGMIILLILAVLTFIGTSSPLITGLFGKASNVSTDYYNTIAAPIAILMGILMALTPVMNWKRNSGEKLRGLFIHILLSLVMGVVIFFLGMRDLIPLLIGITSFFIIFVNSEIVYRMIRRKKYEFGGYLAHVGIGLMLIGIITSSYYDKSTKVTLPKDGQLAVMGYNLSYEGKMPSPDGKDKVLISVNNKQTYAKFYWSSYSRAYMVAPSVKNTLFQDLYISPIQIIPADQNSGGLDEVVLKKGEEKDFENYKLVFDGYDMDMHGMGQDRMKITALIDVKDNYGKTLGIAKPMIMVVGEKNEVQSATFPGTNRSIMIKGISVENNSIALGISGLNSSGNQNAGRELLAVEVSVKPMINVLWIGTFLMIIGFITSVINTRKTRNAV